MSTIVLTEEQVQILAASAGPVNVRDAAGNVYSAIRLELTAAQLERIRNRPRDDRPGVPANKVREHLAALEKEWERTGGFDAAYARGFLEQLRRQDA